jgi:hypothetical protein
VDRRGLKTGLDHWCLNVAQDPPQRAVHRHSDERHDLRAKTLDFLLENLPAFLILNGTQVVDAGARPGDQVGHPDAPLRQPDVVLVRDRLGDDACLVQQAPEPVARPGEVMAHRGRHHAGIDPDEDHPHSRPNRVGQSKIRPGGLRIVGHELAV